MSISPSEFLRTNRWIIAASIFFIIWKFFLIGILWDGRSIAPEPDDSYEYIARIAAVSECQSGLFCPYTGVSMYDHSGFAYLSYGLVFGLIGKAFSLTPENTFYLSFYLGTIILAIALPFFLYAFTQRRSLIALSIIFLAFYHGTGESHGFFWVVPSFYSVVLFFILFRFITSKQLQLGTYLLVSLLAITYAFTHPISIYLVFFFPLYLGVHFYFTKNYSSLEVKKVLFVLIVVLGSAGIQSLYLAQASQLNYYGIGSSINQARQVMDDFTRVNGSQYHFNYNVVQTEARGLLASRIDTLHATYFRYILPHWIIIFPFILSLWMLQYRREFRLLAFYLSSFFFFIVATLFHEFGFRSAIILWPATYLIGAFTFYHVYSSLPNQLSGATLHFWRFISISLLILFFVLNSIFSIGYNLNVNERDNFQIDESFIPSLLERMGPNDHIGLNGILARTQAGSKLFLDRKASAYSSRPRFIARIDQTTEHKMNEQLSFIRKISLKTAYGMGILSHNAEPAEHDKLPRIDGYHLDSQFGDITVFERN